MAWSISSSCFMRSCSLALGPLVATFRNRPPCCRCPALRRKSPLDRPGPCLRQESRANRSAATCRRLHQRADRQLKVPLAGVDHGGYVFVDDQVGRRFVGAHRHHARGGLPKKFVHLASAVIADCTPETSRKRPLAPSSFSTSSLVFAGPAQALEFFRRQQQAVEAGRIAVARRGHGFGGDFFG